MESEDDLFEAPSARQRAPRWIAAQIKAFVLVGAIIGGVVLLAKELRAAPAIMDVFAVLLGVGGLAFVTLCIGFPIHYGLAPKRIEYGLPQPDLFGSRKARLVAIATYAPIAAGLTLFVLWRASE